MKKIIIKSNKQKMQEFKITELDIEKLRNKIYKKVLENELSIDLKDIDTYLTELVPKPNKKDTNVSH